MLFEPRARAGWDILVGQENVKRSLRAAIRNRRLAHAYLFSGPPGAGMDAAAIALARAVLCAEGGDEPCGACRSCVLSGQLQHPGLQLHFPLPVGRNETADDDPLARLTQQEVDRVRAEIAAKAADPYHAIAIPRAGQIKINSVRALRRQAGSGSFDGGRKVFLLLDADRMTQEASNALLKTLEEPVEGTLLVLTTRDAGALLPTVISRCQHVRFDPLTEDDVAGALRSRAGIDAGKAAMAGKLAAGSYSAAVRLVGEDLTARRDAAVDILRCFLHRTPSETANAVRGEAAKERDEIAEMLILMQAWLRDAMLTAAGRPPEANGDDAVTLSKFAAQYPRLDYGAASGAVDRAVSDLRRNVYIPLVLHALRIDLRRAIRPRGAADPGREPR